MFARVQIKHEIDQSSLKSRTGAIQNCESRPRDLGCALKVQNAKRRSQVDVIFWLEIESRFLAPAPNFLVRRFVFSNWNTFMRHIRQGGKSLPDARLGCVPFPIQLSNPTLQ